MRVHLPIASIAQHEPRWQARLNIRGVLKAERSEGILSSGTALLLDACGHTVGAWTLGGARLAVLCDMRTAARSRPQPAVGGPQSAPRHARWVRGCVVVVLALGAGEPELGPWRVVGLEQFVAVVLDAVSVSTRRPLVVAIDGRSSSGKTTLAARLQAAVDGATAVHTDDLAWFHSRFAWTGLLAKGVLEPLREGTSVRFRPPAWDQRGRRGAIEVNRDAGLVIVEGVGAGRRETAQLVDGIVWVQADVNVIARRNAARVAAGEAERDGVAKWMAEEVPFVADQRPWERAFSIVGGSSDVRHDPANQVVLGHPLDGRPSRR